MAAPVSFVDASADGSSARNEYRSVTHDGLDDFTAEAFTGNCVLDVDSLVDANREFSTRGNGESVDGRGTGLCRSSFVGRRRGNAGRGLCAVRAVSRLGGVRSVA